MLTTDYQKIKTLLSSPAEYHSKYIKRIFQKSKEIEIEKVIYNFLTRPDAIGDIYVPIVDPPENPKMQKYLMDLANFINKCMVAHGEIQEDTIRGYKEDLAHGVFGGLPDGYEKFEEKYKEFFRFCLLSFVKIPIQQKDLEYAKALATPIYADLRDSFMLEGIENPETILESSLIFKNLGHSHAASPISFYNGCEILSDFTFSTAIRFNSKTTGKRDKVNLIATCQHLIADAKHKVIRGFNIQLVDNVFEFMGCVKKESLLLKPGVLKIMLDEVLPDYKFEYCFPVLDKKGNFYPFNIGPKTMAELSKNTFTAIDKVYYHWAINRYDKPLEYIKNEILL